MWPTTMRSAFVCISEARRHLAVLCLVAGLGSPGALSAGQGAPRDPAAAAQARDQLTAADEERWQEALQLFDGFRYEQVIDTLDPLISALAESPDADLAGRLAQIYALRARAHFALGRMATAEEDFVKLVELEPSFVLAPEISPRVVTLFTTVKNRMVGQLVLSASPPGEVAVDGRPYAVGAEPRPIELLGGAHSVSASRRGFRSAEESVTVNPGEATTFALVLERISATLTVRTAPAGVAIELDGEPKGATVAQEGTPWASLVLDVQPGAHRLVLTRPCSVTAEHRVTVDDLDDYTVDPVTLAPAVASATIRTSAKGALVFLDGIPQGPAPVTLKDVCEGEHVLELRSPRGRFVDRDTWRTGDAKVFDAVLRPAFAIVGVHEPGATGLIPSIAAALEQMLQEGATVVLYVPAEDDLKAALAAENLSAQSLADLLTGGGTTTLPQRLRDTGRRLSSHLEAQGIAWITLPPDDPGVVAIAIMASGSIRAERLLVRPADPASRGQVRAALAQPAPPVLRPTLDLAVADVADIAGAVVVRSPETGSQAEAGLTPGDVVIQAGGQPVTSVADLRRQVAGVSPPGSLGLEVRGPNGVTRSVSVEVTDSPALIPLRQRALLCNKVLLEMRDVAQTAEEPERRVAARLNLAIADMCVENWEDALGELEQVTLPDRTGVSAGTVAYLIGLCHEALGQDTQARSAFERAAAATGSTLGIDGPPIPLLARSKLGPPR